MRILFILVFLGAAAPVAAFDRGACEAWRDALVEHNALRLAAHRSALALSIAALTDTGGRLRVAQEEAEATKALAQGKALGEAMSAYKRVCLGE